MPPKTSSLRKRKITHTLSSSDPTQTELQIGASNANRNGNGSKTRTRSALSTSTAPVSSSGCRQKATDDLIDMAVSSPSGSINSNTSVIETEDNEPECHEEPQSSFKNVSTTTVCGNTDEEKRLEYPSQFFKYVGPSKVKGCSLYTCVICGSKDTLSACNNSRGNLRKHIKLVHSKDKDSSHLTNFNNLCKELDIRRAYSSKKTENDSSTSSSKNPGSKTTQSVLDFSFRSITQKMLDSAITEYICDAVLPLYHVERPDFRKFMHRLFPHLEVKSRFFFRSEVSKAFLKKKSALKEQLAKATWVSSTADCWSSRRKGFIGLTVHWIDEDLKRKSACLAVRRIIGVCDYNTIAALLEKVYDEFDITSKLTATITDNGSNFVKAFRVYGNKASYSQPSLTSENSQSTAQKPQTAPNSSRRTAPTDKSHARRNERQDRVFDTDETEAIIDFFDEISSPSEAEDDDDEEDSSERFTETESNKSNNRERENSQTGDTEEKMTYHQITDLMARSRSKTNALYLLPPHRRCAAHTINLIAQVDLERIYDPDLLSLHDSVSEKMKQIWRAQNYSTKASDHVRLKLKRLFITPNTTRWNSYYNAFCRLKSFIEQKRSELRNVFDYFGVPYLRPAEEEFVREYVTVVKPLAEALDVLQADKKIGIGYLLPTLTILLNEMEDLKGNASIQHCQPYIYEIIKGLKIRFDGYFEDIELQISAMVHPNFKVLWLKEEDKMDHIRRLKEIWKVVAKEGNANEQLKSVKTGAAVTVTECESDSEMSEFSSPTRKRKNFFKSLVKVQEPNQESEVDLYLNDPSTEVSSLDKYPTIRKMYIKYNAALPSSASVERMFSVCGQIFRPTRSNLSDSNFEKLTFLRINNNL